ncbi:MAG TPA: endolytic transglycosylase MltG [Bacilli bacterium]|nr:endolytic transglycosylase MltG [Bacilli bacterium]
MTDKQPPRIPEQKASRGQKWWYAFALCILVLGGGLFYVQQQLTPPDRSGKAVEVEIKPGAGAVEIGVELERKELIRNATFFKWYLSFEGKGSELKAGSYYLTQGMSMEEITRVLVEGDAHYGTTQFTIPEGLNLEQIADKLADDGLVDKQKFLDEADNGTFDYDFVAAIPKQEGMKHRLEGYLFPDTYEVMKDADEHVIIDTMLKQTDAVLTPEWRAEMDKRQMTVHQILTLASLVEREARVSKERPTIAGVIYNRLHTDPPMKLQIDATVQFALGKTKETLLYEDLEIDSPYNTYLHEGLPPGPIASPGRESIQAAIYPAQHDFLFYVTKNDGSGEHYFAATFAEHEQNIAKSQ